ncbi:MAG: glycosyltransferase family 4 protein [Candidatus Micrarchaeota archaeon]
MRICFVDLFMDLECSGGSMHSLDLYATKLAERGHEVSILTFYPKRNIGFDRTKKPYKIIEDPLDIKSHIDLTLTLKDKLKKYEKKFDIYHMHDPRLLLGAALYRKFDGKIPVVGDLNTYLFYRKNFGATDIITLPIRFLHKQRLRLIDKYCDLLFPVSPYVENIYREYGIRKEKLFMIGDGFDFSKSKLAKRSDKKENSFRLLYLGRLEHTKGVDLIIRALSLVNKPLISLDIAGDGPEKEKLVELAKKLGIEKQVTFHGFITNEKMYNLFAKCDVFIHAPRWEEAFGRAIVDAMYAGLPVIVADIGGCPWVAGEGGLKFKSEDELELAKKIDLLYFDIKLREKLSEAGIERAKYFDVKNTIDKFEEAYNKLAGGK